MSATMKASWGRLSLQQHDVVSLSQRRTAAAIVASTHVPGLPSGMQRSYGDVCTNAGGTLWDCRGLDKLIAFDEESGALTCEAGVLLRDIQAVFMSRGWALPVTPGTELVTVGGAIANDVHGKNHPAQGSFGDHVVGLTLLRTDGELIRCSPTENPELLAATVGGLGLTGVILSATLGLKAVPGPWLETEDVVFESLDEFFDLSDASAASFEYSVAWVDAATDRGRGILTRANPVAVTHRRPGSERAVGLPITPPVSLVGPRTASTFNRAYFRLKALRAGRRIEHYRSFFSPLDAVRDWNRMYGPKGFFQHQSVIPTTEARSAIAEMLRVVSSARVGSNLGVLKTFGDRSAVGMLSFPRPGVTFAVDLPHRGHETMAVMSRLDDIVRASGGRLYLAKDARMPSDLFEAGYPRIEEFVAHRDPGISSDLSRRLLGA